MIWITVSCLIAVALLVASCATATTDEVEVTPRDEEEVASKEEEELVLECPTEKLTEARLPD